MKNLLFVFFTGVFSCHLLMAGNAQLFQLDENVILKKIEKLNQLENFVNQYGDVALSQIQKNDKELLINIDTNNFQNLDSVNTPPLGIPSFFWGACLSVPGLIIAAIVTNDKKETQYAGWGCLSNSALIFFIWLLKIYGPALGDIHHC